MTVETSSNKGLLEALIRVGAVWGIRYLDTCSLKFEGVRLLYPVRIFIDFLVVYVCAFGGRFILTWP